MKFPTTPNVVAAIAGYPSVLSWKPFRPKVTAVWWWICATLLPLNPPRLRITVNDAFHAVALPPGGGEESPHDDYAKAKAHVARVEFLAAVWRVGYNEIALRTTRGSGWATSSAEQFPLPGRRWTLTSKSEGPAGRTKQKAAPVSRSGFEFRKANYFFLATVA
jgi:hypothetical protein